MNMLRRSRAGAAQHPAAPAWTDWLGATLSAHPRWWQRLARIESNLLRDRIDALAIRGPLYVTGLAGSGRAGLTQILAAHADTASHDDRDLPLIYTPWLWNRYLGRAAAGLDLSVDRADRDRLSQLPARTQASEEPLWMGFFPHLHRPGASDVLGFMTDAPAFEDFYRDHLRKLLLLRGGHRYLAQGSHHSTRIEYLLNLFPDARFVLAVREPGAQIAELLRQHARCAARHRADPRLRQRMRRQGHFELGLDRRPIHIGDGEQAAATAEAWRLGREAEGYARAWDDLYRFVADRMEAMPALREAILVVRHEDLRDQPERSLGALFAHCDLDVTPADIQRCVAQLPRGDGDGPRLDDTAQRVIERVTARTAARFGYGPSATASTTATALSPRGMTG